MNEPGKAQDLSSIETLKKMSTFIQLGGAFIANIAAAFGWMSKYFNLLPLPSGQKPTGIFLSIILSLFGILLVWFWLISPGRDNRSRAQRLLIGAGGALVGFLVAAVAFDLVDNLWKISGVNAAEIMINLAMPLLFALGHALLSIFLCCLSLVTFAPGIGLLGRTSTEVAKP